MCGIHGFNFADQKLIRKMMSTAAHRGPDDEGLHVGEGISLGHNRLSIIDLSEKGRNPMWSHDRRYAIVFNGEIYNFKKIKSELIKKGHTFYSGTDTEVILIGFIEWGEEIVKKLDGIFAFAIWDSLSKKLFLARDPIGIKPLYYYRSGETFIFSSEIKSILEHNIPRVLNKEALNLYNAVSYVPGPHTLFKDIFKLLPAHYMHVIKGEIEMHKYWDPDTTPLASSSKSDLTDGIRERILKAVEDQLISDRPLGVYLSGGIDSSVVLSSMSKVRGDIDTFSVGFDVDEHEEPEKFNADFLLARKTAEYFGTNHHELEVSSDDAVNSLEDIVWHMDEPISNPTAVAMYKLAQYSKKTATVVLSGEGGDELFAGYDYYRMNRAADLYHLVPSGLRQLISTTSTLKKLNTPAGVERYARFMMRNSKDVQSFVPDFDFKGALSFFDAHYFQIKPVSSADALMNAHRQSWLVDHALLLADKMSMASAVEVRVPLLSKDVVEYAVRIPAGHKASLWDTKIILKEAFKKEIPGFLLGQPKRGWFSPGAKWLRNPRMFSLAHELLSPGYHSQTAELYDWSVLREMLDSHKRGGYYRIPLWSALTFQLWAKKFNITL